MPSQNVGDVHTLQRDILHGFTVVHKRIILQFEDHHLKSCVNETSEVYYKSSRPLCKDCIVSEQKYWKNVTNFVDHHVCGFRFDELFPRLDRNSMLDLNTSSLIYTQTYICKCTKENDDK